MSSFFGIKLNYWHLDINTNKIVNVRLPVMEYFHKKMGITKPSEYNVLDIFYNKNDKISFYSYYITFTIPPNVKKYYLVCKDENNNK